MTKPKLLLADDSVTIRKVVELTFADEGIEVTSVGDATAAMRSFVEMQPDIVLVDAGLAGTNGYQICEMIKSDEATKHIPVMLLAGSFEPFDADEAHRVGADGFMTKPFHSIRDLVARVWTLLKADEEAHQASDSAPAAVPEEEGTVEPLPGPETSDIDHLYASSFADTAEMEQFETVEHFGEIGDLGDPGMDDEMIEASYLSNSREDEVELDLGSAPPAPARAFDWSPEAIISETLTDLPVDEKHLDPAEWAEPEDENRQAEEELIFNPATAKSEEPEVPPVDETPEAEVPEVEEERADISTFETIEFSNVPSVVRVPFPDSSSGILDDETANESPAERIFDDEPIEEEVAEDGTQQEGEAENSAELADDSDPAIHETIPYSAGEQPPIPTPKADDPAIPDELIDQIVKRVVEKLSDSVVREIALVEVPRIAEKLMREALNQDRRD